MQGQTGLCKELSGLTLMERPHLTVELVEQVLIHPLGGSGALDMAIYGNPLPQSSVSPIN